MKKMNSKLMQVAFWALVLSSAIVAQDDNQPSRAPDVVYVPTPHAVVDRMLSLAKVTKGDVVYDLGSGDGRIVIAAAKKYGATGKGIDINPALVAEARENAKKAEVSDKVEFIVGDLFEQDLSKATVVTLYLLSSLNLKLRPTLMALKPGTRIVSHAFDMGDWKPDRSEIVEGSSVYFWTVPENPANTKPKAPVRSDN
jgi:SAM-dependent methyltransferase